MNKKQLEAEKAKLADEKKVLSALQKQYQEAAKEVQAKIHIRDNKINIMLEEWDDIDDEKRSILQSQIYQKKFQQQLKVQIEETIKKLNDGQYKSIQEYLDDSYKTGVAGNAYDLHGQDVPLVMPIDKRAMLRSVKLDPKISKRLYGSYMDDLKDSIRSEISRGIATADSYEHIARNITNKTNQSFNRTMRIVRTEGHRIQAEAAFEQMKKAKKAGADIVKQWDATLDGRTRPSHRRVDGEIRDVEDKFSNGLMYPGDKRGGPGEVINCRCALLQRAKWALDEEELATLKKRAKYFGLDKSENFKEFKRKYLDAAEKVATIAAEATLLKMTFDQVFEEKNRAKSEEINDTDVKAVYDYMSPLSYVVNDKLRNETELTPEDIEFIMKLDAALDKMPTYSGNLQRSLYFDNAETIKAFLATHQVGEVVTYDEYLSATKGETYNPEGQVQIFIVDSKNGRDISEYNPSEQEVLYKRKSSFYIQKVVERDGKYYILMVENNE